MPKPTVHTAGLMLGKIEESTRSLRRLIRTRKPTMAIILGSGLSKFARRLSNTISIPYKNIPHFATSTTAGHSGNLVFGTLWGKSVVVMEGRVHFYEGYTMQEVTFPIRVLHQLGVRNLIITNACGGLNPTEHKLGDLMLISDHIGFLMGDDPLVGPNIPGYGPRFIDMSAPYDPDWLALARHIALGQGTRIHDGVFCPVSGPTYETRAELKALRLLGVDGVGMSTVPEVKVARHCGWRVLGISVITDVVSHTKVQKVDHDEVLAVAKNSSTSLSNLIAEFVRRA